MEKKQLSTKEKILFGLSTAGTIVTIVLASLQTLNIWPQGRNLYLPMMGLVLLCQVELNKEKSPSVSKVCMVCAIVIFAVLMLNIIL